MSYMRLFVLWPILFTSCFTKNTPPHIVFILADDLGWNDVSFHGFRQIPTPNIDILAQDGIILNKYYTYPLCTPSRSSLMTGKYATRLGLQHFVIDAAAPYGMPLAEKTLPEYLNGLGYVSYGVGKWHLGFYKNEYLPTQRGFKSFFGYWTGAKDYYSHFAKEDDFFGLDLHNDEKPAWGYDGVYATDLFTSKATSVIRTHNTSQPLFLYLSHQAVHSGNFDTEPLQPPRFYEQKFSYIKDEDRRKFAGMVSRMDSSVGEIFSALEESGMLENTLIVFSSDNGGAVESIDNTTGSNWPLRGSKYTLWEGGIRVPSWIWSAKLRNKRRIGNGLFHISDWVPTLYAAAGGNTKDLKGLDGVDQWPTLLRKRHMPRKEIFHNSDDTDKTTALRKGVYKLVIGKVYDGILDDWFDIQGKNLSKSLETKFSTMETDLFEQIYRKELMNCKVANILHRSYGKNISAVAGDLRNSQATVNCGIKPENFRSNCKPDKSPCLFNIESDPCEYTNMAEVLPHVLQHMKQLLEDYKRNVVPPLEAPKDPAADPKLHGNAWIPWKSL